jgi:5-methyltetrahydrofolate--homocysteine methyltransferase
MEPTLQRIYDGILEGDSQTVKENVQAALDAGVAPGTILNEGMIAAMKEVGNRFEIGDYFVPEMLIAARAMKDGLAILKPRLAGENIPTAGKIIIGTVKGDLHDIGKNLVGMMMEGAGFEVCDLGTDVTPEKYVETVRAMGGNGPVLLGMSALLTTTMPNMKTTIEALKSAGLRDNVKVIIGGAPITDSYAKQIGADGYAPDASRAVSTAESLLK